MILENIFNFFFVVLVGGYVGFDEEMLWVKVIWVIEWGKLRGVYEF